MAAIQPPMTASRPFCALVGRWNILVETASPFSRTAAILEVVAPLSVPMKIFSLMFAPLNCGQRRQRQELFAFRRSIPFNSARVTRVRNIFEICSAATRPCWRSRRCRT